MSQQSATVTLIYLGPKEMLLVSRPFAYKAFALLLLLATSLSAKGAVLEFHSSGVTESALPGTTIAAGQSFAASFDLDTSSPSTQDYGPTQHYPDAISNIQVSMGGISPLPYSGVPTQFVNASNTTQLTFAFNFDGQAAPFNGAGQPDIGRLQFTFLATDLLGTAEELSTVDVAQLSTLTPRQFFISDFGGNETRILLDTFNLSSGTSAPTAVHEPMTFALLFMGLVGVRRRTWRR